MVVGEIDASVAFLREVFGAQGEVHAGRPAELAIGDSLVMVSQAGERETFPAFLYVYVDDVDAVHGRAIGAGADELEEPQSTSYGERRAMFRDRHGNVYQVARPLRAD